jgi:sugar phosphate isomerase/epimerase
VRPEEADAAASSPRPGPQNMELTLWAASVKAFPLVERLDAARDGGFTATSLFPYEIARARDEGLAPDDVRALFESHGIRVAVIDPLTRWLPGSAVPTDLPPDDPAFGALLPDEIFALALALGAEVVTVLALFDDPVEAAAGARAFAALCDRAAERDLRLALEFIPGTGIANLASAWEIVRRTNRPNGGLMLDSWHFFRSDPDFALLATIPSEFVFAVQLEDAPGVPAPDLAHESLHERLIPGDGELDLRAFLSTVLAAGTPPLIGPEVFSDRTHEMPASGLGRLLGERTRELLEASVPSAHETNR